MKKQEYKSKILPIVVQQSYKHSSIHLEGYMADLEFRMAVPELFRFSEVYMYVSRSSNECMYHAADGAICKVLTLPQGNIVLKVSGVDDVPEPYLLVHIFNGDLSLPRDSRETIKADIRAYIREWFDLDRDLRPFYEIGKKDPLLHKAITAFHGLRIVGIPNLFEALCWGIIGQQINLAFAYTLKRRFVEAFGQATVWNGTTLWQFPHPETIASLTAEDLIALGMTSKKSEYLIGTATLMAEGSLSKAGLLALQDLSEMEKKLIAIRGIGPWTANYVLMRCIRMPSAFPIADVGLHNAIKHVQGMESKPALEEIRRLSDGWRGWEAYATFYLWRFLY